MVSRDSSGGCSTGCALNQDDTSPAAVSSNLPADPWLSEGRPLLNRQDISLVRVPLLLAVTVFESV